MFNLELEKDTFINLGGIKTGEEARAFLDNRLDWESKVKLKMIKNEMVLVKIANVISVTNPKAVFINSGYEYEVEWIKSQSMKMGEESISVVYEDAVQSDLEDQHCGIMEGMIMMIGFYNRGPLGDQGSIPTLEISSSAHVLQCANESYQNCFHNFDAEVEKNGQFRMYVHTKGASCPSYMGHSILAAAGA